MKEELFNPVRVIEQRSAYRGGRRTVRWKLKPLKEFLGPYYVLTVFNIIGIIYICYLLATLRVAP